MSEVVENVEGEVKNPEAPEGASGGVEVSEYIPNYKYTVLDEEKELPEWVRPVIKDSEIEKNIRETFSKAAGLDHVKARREFLEKENKQYREQWTPIVKTAQQLEEQRKKKDYESLFENLGIPEEDLFGYVSKRLDLLQNPQQYEMHQSARQMQLQNQQLQEQNQTFLQERQELAAQRRAWELDMELQKPDLVAAVQDFDNRLGQSGSFRNEVIRIGQHYAAQGRDISPEEASREVLRLIGWQGSNQTQTVQSKPTGVKPPTIPNIRGKGTSPAKLVPKSTDQLRDLARKMRLGE